MSDPGNASVRRIEADVKKSLHHDSKQIMNTLKRKHFIRTLGGVLTGTAIVVACNDDGPGSGPDGMNLGSGDAGLQNYFLTIKQLTSGFYEQLVASSSFASLFSADEQSILTDIRNHEVVHREYLRAALGSRAIPNVELNLAAIDFNNKDQVLETAEDFENLCVAAYNDALQLINDTNLALVMMKMASVEGRHAAVISTIIAPRTSSFAADAVVNSQGLGETKAPATVITEIQPYITDEIIATGLPTS